MREATVERLSSGIYYACIPSCPGVWADGGTADQCLRGLQGVLEEWIVLKLRDGDTDFPLLGGVNLNRAHAPQSG